MVRDHRLHAQDQAGDGGDRQRRHAQGRRDQFARLRRIDADVLRRRKIQRQRARHARQVLRRAAALAAGARHGGALYRGVSAEVMLSLSPILRSPRSGDANGENIVARLWLNPRASAPSSITGGGSGPPILGYTRAVGAKRKSPGTKARGSRWIPEAL